MIKYNYYYCEEFKEVILTKKNNEKVILNKIELKKYLKSKCLISIFQKLLHSLQGKDFSEDEIRRSIDTLLNSNKIYFIRMPNYISSFTIYDGTIFINRNFFDEASCPYKKVEKEEEKDKDKDKNKKGKKGKGKTDKKGGKSKDKDKGKDKKDKNKNNENNEDNKKDENKNDENKNDENKNNEKKEEENKNKEKENKEKEKEKINIENNNDEENKNTETEDAVCGYGAVLILMFREIALGLNKLADVEGNFFLNSQKKFIINNKSYFIELVEKKFEYLLLGGSKYSDVLNIFPYSSKYNNYNGFLFLTNLDNYNNLTRQQFRKKYNKILKKEMKCSNYWEMNYILSEEIKNINNDYEDEDDRDLVGEHGEDDDENEGKKKMYEMITEEDKRNMKRINKEFFLYLTRGKFKEREREREREREKERERKKKEKEKENEKENDKDKDKDKKE